MRSPRSMGERLLLGILAGTTGAGVMTALRLGARRAGWIDRMPPQVVEEWIARRLGGRPSADPRHHVFDQLLHWGYGAAVGGAWGVLGGRAAGRVGAGLAYGFAVWAGSLGILAPLVGFARAPWRSRPIENAVNVSAHLAFGGVLALVLGELEEQRRLGGISDGERTRARVG